MAGTNFKESTDAEMVQLFHFPDKLNGLGQLSGEEMAGSSNIVRVYLGGAISKDGHRPWVPLDRFEGGAERLDRRGYQRTVESRRHSQTLSRNLPRSKDGGGAFDDRSWTGEHGLPRGILVG